MSNSQRVSLPLRPRNASGGIYGHQPVGATSYRAGLILFCVALCSAARLRERPTTSRCAPRSTAAVKATMPCLASASLIVLFSCYSWTLCVARCSGGAYNCLARVGLAFASTFDAS